jgi:hypothetical protein
VTAIAERAEPRWIDDDRGWASAAAPLQSWLADARSCEAPGLDGEADVWLAQVHREARLGVDALRLVQLARDGRLGEGIELAFAVGALWGAARRADKTVMGARYGLQPALGQRPDGTWCFHPESVIENENAIDTLVRAALNFFATRSTQE